MCVRSQGLYLPFDTLRVRKSLQRGVSLVEVILFIVIISVAVAGILLVMNKVSGHSSADALLRKQSLAIAESLLEEIQLQGISGVTPNPALPANADRSNFDNVFNYAGYNTTAGILAMDTTPVPRLAGYNVAPPVVVVNTPAIWGGVAVAAGSAVVITVSVTDPAGQVVNLTGYKAN